MYYLLALLILLMVLLIRAVSFKPAEVENYAKSDLPLDEEKIVETFRGMIRCQTVSYNDTAKMESQEFLKFKELLVASYPHIEKDCLREEIGERGLLYRFKGKTDQNPTVLMSHFDVVPADEEQWDKPPFAAVLEDGVIWGRGTLDTKGTLCGVLEAAEYLLAQGFVPERDIYFSFSGDEEIGGPSAPAIVEELKKRGVSPALVLDEGGAIVQGIFPGVAKEAALIGIGEKGYLDISLEIKGQGGHSSAPPASTLAGVMAKAIVAIERKPFKAALTPPVRELLNTLGRHSSFGLKVVFANLWLFGPLLKRVFGKKGGEINAMIRTTAAVTKLAGSQSFNVMPPRVTAGVNLRLLNTDTVDSALSYIKSIMNNEDISIEVIQQREASPLSSTKTREWETVKAAVGKTWPGTIVSPYLMMAGTDSRHFCEISPNVLRFSAMKLSLEELKLIHGNNERIPVSKLLDVVRFYVELMKMC